MLNRIESVRKIVKGTEVDNVYQVSGRINLLRVNCPGCSKGYADVEVENVYPGSRRLAGVVVQVVRIVNCTCKTT